MAGPAERIRVRPARRSDAEALARIHVEAWRESYRTILGPAAARPDALARRLRLWRRLLARPRQGGAVFVAELDGEPVGFGSCGPQREDDRLADGEIYALYLLRRAHRRGLGRALMAAMARTLLAHGMGSADCWALEGNAPALRFYAAMGGRAEARRMAPVMGRVLAERAFVWDDLATAPFL
jgi:GNAT superfamily N-acetyltransferase